MTADADRVWVGLEYFCTEGDPIWNMSDELLAELAARELAQLDLIESGDVLDRVVARVPKAYPVYAGAYQEMHTLRAFLDDFENLFVLGRSGMHRYNNQDHSMLTAMTAVDNLTRGITAKDNIWAVNAEQDYHESTEA